MEQFVSTIVLFTVSLGVFAYFFVFLCALLETILGVGLIVPGSVAVLFFGAGAQGGELSLWILIPAAAFGALLGDNVNYYLGRRYGRAWIFQKRWILSARHYDEGERFFRAHGGKSVFLGRFVPVIKEVVPFIAGTIRMDRKQFMIYNALGAVGWAMQWIGLGYLFAYYIESAQRWIVRIDIGFLILFLLIVGYYVYTRQKTRLS